MHPERMTPALYLSVFLGAIIFWGFSAANAEESLISEALTGNSLSDADRDALEAQVKANPDDKNARVRLVGWYSRKRSPAGTPHKLWVIKNLPASDLAGSPFCQFFKPLDPDSYLAGAKLWTEHTAPEVVLADILIHAAGFFALNDRATSEQLLQRGMKEFPTDTRFSVELARTYTRNRPPQYDKALVLFEQALAATTDESQRFYLLGDVAKAAVAAGDPAKAKQYATELLTLADRIQDWNTGNAIHHGHLVLGRVAVMEGNLELAGQHLLKAGETKGSPQLNSFGPNMTLAKDLLERGQKDPVLAYLDLCSKFWKDRRLGKWKQQVQAGQMPDFGANLAY
jgi:tetratricopeptide (TPR) repeat protein